MILQFDSLWSVFLASGSIYIKKLDVNFKKVLILHKNIVLNFTEKLGVMATLDLISDRAALGWIWVLAAQFRCALLQFIAVLTWTHAMSAWSPDMSL